MCVEVHRFDITVNQFPNHFPGKVLGVVSETTIFYALPDFFPTHVSAFFLTLSDDSNAKIKANFKKKKIFRKIFTFLPERLLTESKLSGKIPAVASGQ